ncbi:hypothetical protein BKA61DRAFT_586337 [Leptodontidium sp. MPI-SDFR-AT-0119]|nr:hypothetical protein BKA61DRAFT_586337 [Leptodontidium sp. MPI-SDFR-AT-0119]
MANQVSPKPEFAEQDYSKEGVLQTLLRVSQSDLRDCRTICYLLSTYHFESTEPVRLSDHYSLQLYPIRAGSLHPNLQTPIKPLDTNLLYKVTLCFETPNNNSYSEDIFQASLKKVLTVAILLTTRFTTSPTTSTATATIISTIRRRSSSMIRGSLNSLVALKLLKWFIAVHLKPKIDICLWQLWQFWLWWWLWWLWQLKGNDPQPVHYISTSR